MDDKHKSLEIWYSSDVTLHSHASDSRVIVSTLLALVESYLYHVSNPRGLASKLGALVHSYWYVCNSNC